MGHYRIDDGRGYVCWVTLIGRWAWQRSNRVAAAAAAAAAADADDASLLSHHFSTELRNNRSK